MAERNGPPAYELTGSARRVLRAVATVDGEATFEALLLRVRPMSEAGLTRSVYELERKGLIHLSNHDGCATITDAGRTQLEDAPDGR